jgi:transposase-like protein
MSRTSDSAKKKAIAEYLATGNVTKAAKIGGVDRSTLHRWLQKDDKAVKEAKAAVGDDVYEKLRALLQKGLRKLDAALDADDLTAPQAAQVVAIVGDNVRRFAPRAAPGTDDTPGDWVITVRRGGARVSTGQVDENGMVVLDAENLSEREPERNKPEAP